MMLKNYTELGLYNGSRGVVEGFQDGTRHPLVRFVKCGQTIIEPAKWTFDRATNESPATRQQYPLALAWVSDYSARCRDA